MKEKNVLFPFSFIILFTTSIISYQANSQVKDNWNGTAEQV